MSVSFKGDAVAGKERKQEPGRHGFYLYISAACEIDPAGIFQEYKYC
jgi:hypothetical protein